MQFRVENASFSTEMRNPISIGCAKETALRLYLHRYRQHRAAQQLVRRGRELDVCARHLVFLLARPMVIAFVPLNPSTVGEVRNQPTMKT